MIIDGKAIAAKIKLKVREEIARRKISPALAVVLVGTNPASQVYVRNKIAACEETGIKSFAYYLNTDAAEAELVELIAALNSDKKINGILVQLPLPAQINEQKILSLIKPEKDVDGFHAVNAGNLFLGLPSLRPCTPSGIIELLKNTGEPLAGKHAVVVGRSNIVGKPAAIMLLEQNATVTIAHSRTAGLASVTCAADILIAAAGKPKLITASFVKKGAIVIDVGTNRIVDEKGVPKLVGDVDFEAVSKIASYITPVPGGVGPMTIAMLMDNTLKASL